VVSIDQGAIRGSRWSNPATYTGLLDPIRKAFAKANGVKPALFSANSEGACPHCNGAGVIYTDLAMMAGVATTCEECEGKRFQASVLDHHLGGRDISEVLAMSVTEAQEFFGAGEAAHAGRARRPRPARRRRARLPAPRPAAHYAVRRRAAAAQAGHPHGRRQQYLHPR
jgi:excinuclease UvrABC ATPase subunit